MVGESIGEQTPLLVFSLPPGIGSCHLSASTAGCISIDHTRISCLSPRSRAMGILCSGNLSTQAIGHEHGSAARYHRERRERHPLCPSKVSRSLVRAQARTRGSNPYIRVQACGGPGRTPASATRSTLLEATSTHTIGVKDPRCYVEAFRNSFCFLHAEKLDLKCPIFLNPT